MTTCRRFTYGVLFAFVLKLGLLKIHSWGGERTQTDFFLNLVKPKLTIHPSMYLLSFCILLK